MSDPITSTLHAGNEGDHAPDPQAKRIRALLDDYDNLNDRAKIELVQLYRELTPVEVALLHSDPALTANVERFRSDSKRFLKTPFRDYAVLVGIAVAAVTVFAWAFAFR